MNRGLLAVALACGLLAGCASPRDTFSTGPSNPATFRYVAESYDLFPTRRYEGEVRRLQELQQYLASNNLCGGGYGIDRRDEAGDQGSFLSQFFQGKIFQVTYQGHCRTAFAPMPSPAASLAPVEPPAPTVLEAPAPVTPAPLEAPPRIVLEGPAPPTIEEAVPSAAVPLETSAPLPAEQVDAPGPTEMPGSPVGPTG